MFRLDYRHLLRGPDLEQRLQRMRDHTFDAVEYLWKFAQKNRLNVAELFPAARFRLGTRLFYHSHCQQKTTGSPHTAARLSPAWKSFALVAPSPKNASATPGDFR